MGSRAGYTLLTGLFIGLGGILGYVSFIVELIPRAVLAPILIFVALEIMVQAFLSCPRRHAVAAAFAFFQPWRDFWPSSTQTRPSCRPNA